MLLPLLLPNSVEAKVSIIETILLVAQVEVHVAGYMMEHAGDSAHGKFHIRWVERESRGLGNGDVLDGLHEEDECVDEVVGEECHVPACC